MTFLNALINLINIIFYLFQPCNVILQFHRKHKLCYLSLHFCWVSEISTSISSIIFILSITSFSFSSWSEFSAFSINLLSLRTYLKMSYFLYLSIFFPRISMLLHHQELFWIHSSSAFAIRSLYSNSLDLNSAIQVSTGSNTLGWSKHRVARRDA